MAEWPYGNVTLLGLVVPGAEPTEPKVHVYQPSGLLAPLVEIKPEVIDLEPGCSGQYVEESGLWQPLPDVGGNHFVPPVYMISDYFPTLTSGDYYSFGPTQADEELAQICPALTEVWEWDCPVLECLDRPLSLSHIIQHLNDHHSWPREAIADWLDTLDVDLTFAAASQGD